MARYVMEAEWLGYRSSQDRIVHREVVPRARAIRLDGLHKIFFTDGTSLRITVREAAHRERVQEINGYGELIRRAERSNQTIYAATAQTVGAP